MRRVCFSLAAIAFLNSSLPVSAHVTPDGTLNTTVSSTDGLNFTITQGQAAGSNLFHSFDRFSIPTNGSATFNLINTPNISTIFSRITGRDVSSIDGLIQSSNPVNLFLLNPNGVLLGANARLNIGGSFVGTTASAIRFADGTEVSAAPSTPLLTMSAPIGLQFGGNPGAIAVQGTGHQLIERDPLGTLPFQSQPVSGFQVASGQTLALIGGNVTLTNGILTAERGQIAIGSVRSPDVVRLTPTAQGYEFNYSGATNFGEVSLTGRSLVDVSGSPAGSVQIQARQVNLQDGSVVLLQNRGARPGGSLTVVASDSILAQGSTLPTLVQGSPFPILGGGAFPQQTRVRSGFYSETLIGDGSDISLIAPQVLMKNGGLGLTRTTGAATGGAIRVTADRLQAAGVPNDFSMGGGLTSLTAGRGRAGAIAVSANQVDLFGGGVVSSSASFNGQAGDIDFNAKHIFMTGSEGGNIGSIASISRGNGRSGNLRINTQTLRMERGSSLGTAGFLGGTAGSVEVNASERIDLSGTNSAAFGSGLSPTRIDSSVLENAAFGRSRGNAGTVAVNTPRLRIANQAEISVKNQGIGDGGALKVNVDSIQLESGGALIGATVSGSGGDIVVNAREFLLMRDRAQILTDSKGTGNGGNINISAPVIVGLNNSDIIANAIAGRGGNIAITTQAIFGLTYRDLTNPQAVPTSDISAKSQMSLSGNVSITTPGVDPNSGLVELSEKILDTNQTVAIGCSVPQGSQFIVTGRGGMPENPNERVNYSRPWSDLRAVIPSSRAVISEKQPTVLVEATSWHRNAEGKIEMTAGKIASPAVQATC